MARSGCGAHARRAVRTVARRAAFLVTTACLALVAGCGLLPTAPGTPDSAGQSCGSRSTSTFAIGPDDISWLQPIIAKCNEANPSDQATTLLPPQTSNRHLATLVANPHAHSCPYDIID